MTDTGSKRCLSWLHLNSTVAISFLPIKSAVAAYRSLHFCPYRPLLARTIAFSWGLVLAFVKTGGIKLAGRTVDCPKVVTNGLGACAFARINCSHSCCCCGSWHASCAHCFNTRGDAVQFQTLS